MRVTNLVIVAIAQLLSVATPAGAVDLKLKAAGKVYRDERDLEEDQELESSLIRSGRDKEELERSRAKALLEIIDCDDLPKDEIELELGYKPSSGLETLHNPFFDRKIALPARVLVFDEKKSYLGDLVYCEAKPKDAEGEDGYYHGVFGTRLRIRIADKTEAMPIEGAGDDGQGIRTLGPGTHYLQAVYTRSLKQRSDEESELGPLASDPKRSADFNATANKKESAAP